MITAIRDRSTITAEQAQGFCGIGNDHPDVQVQMFAHLVQVAKEMADVYCNNRFLAADGTEMPIPAPVEMGIVRLVQDLFTRRLPGQTQQQTGGLGFTIDATLAPEDVLRLWRPYRILPGL